ncbi:hypothetical protein DP116_04685 [Brasilonema bromeliae SPC951]|uniref:Uncharacterized protein n=1 Tax=Brasilonema bromeliae SPC951 TaxID=385972 RepID=A0ABX1P350_9CYAN|nr:hypothetical protein [Brasilonema bromeliae SPC951]
MVFIPRLFLNASACPPGIFYALWLTPRLEAERARCANGDAESQSDTLRERERQMLYLGSHPAASFFMSLGWTTRQQCLLVKPEIWMYFCGESSAVRGFPPVEATGEPEGHYQKI